MEMQQIRYFLSLAQTLNFTRAAEECNVTQPALTRAIQALEAELGGDLLRRERQNSHLTELGQRMLPLMRRCYDSALSAKELARAVLTSDVAPLSIAVSHSVNLELFMEAIAELFRTFAGIQLKVLRGDSKAIVEMLKEGKADLAVAGALNEQWERLDSWPLFTEAFELAVHPEHELASANEFSAERLTGAKILIQNGCDSLDDAMRRLGLEDATDNAAHHVVTQHDLAVLLQANLGVAIVPASAPHDDVVRRMSLNDTSLRRTVTVYGVAGRQRSPAGAAFLNLVRAADWTAYAA